MLTIGDLAIQALQNWNTQPNLRSEFKNNFGNYAAFVRNQLAGKVRILGEKKP